jgi:hypothetical protein
MLKNPGEYERDIRQQNSWPFLAKILLLCYQLSLLVVAREFWLMNKE